MKPLLSPSGAPDVDSPADVLHDGLPPASRRWAVIAIWLTISFSILDSVIANLALPTIARDLGTSASSSIWVVNAYQVAITMLLLPLASLGEVLSIRRVYLVGVAVFVLASLACAFTNSITALAVARLVQGFGAAAIMALNGALMRFIYPRAMLGRGLSYNSLVVALSSAIGPTIAAIILSFGSWRLLFAVNVPIGVIALVLGWRFLPEIPQSQRRFDWISAAMTMLTFAALFVATSDFAHGHASLQALGALVIGLVLGTFLYRRSRGERDPLVPVDLVRIPLLRLSYATSICAFGAQMIGLIALPFYLQSRLGLDHVATGLMITALPVGVALAAPLAGRLIERVPAGKMGGVGLLILAAGYLLTALAGANGSTGPMAGAIAICGFGFGLFQSPNNRTMLGVAPVTRCGAAAGMLATARLIGQTMGAVSVALVFRLAGTVSLVPFLLCTGLGVLAAVLSFLRHAPTGSQSTA